MVGGEEMGERCVEMIGDNDLEAQEAGSAGLSQDLSSVVYTPSF